MEIDIDIDVDIDMDQSFFRFGLEDVKPTWGVSSSYWDSWGSEGFCLASTPKSPPGPSAQGLGQASSCLFGMVVFINCKLRISFVECSVV